MAGAFAGGLKSNKILSSSPWLFNLNYQGCGYSGVKAARNESFIFGSVDPLSFYLTIPKNDYTELKQMWIQIPGLICEPYEFDGFVDRCYFSDAPCSAVID